MEFKGDIQNLLSTYCIYSFSPEHALFAVPIIESYITDVFSKLLANKLSANPNKTEYLLFNCKNINQQVIININLDSDIISPSYSAKKSRCFVQSDISLDNHISSVIKSYLCNFVTLAVFIS